MGIESGTGRCTECREIRRGALFGEDAVLVCAGCLHAGLGVLQRAQIPPVVLGTAPDVEIAKQYGCSRVTVWKARKALGIPAFRSGWKRKISEQSDLGKVSDAVIAKRLRCSPAVVSQARNALGLQPASPGKHAAVDPEFWTAPARVIAERYGLSRGYVHQLRKKHRTETTGKGEKS